LGEKDNCGHPRLVYGLHDGLRRADTKCERLVQHEVAACYGSTDGQARLDIRRDGDAYGIDRAQELIEVVITL
jgi:hypothetical protein